jgi:hypothetical protein
MDATIPLSTGRKGYFWLKASTRPGRSGAENYFRRRARRPKEARIVSKVVEGSGIKAGSG